MAQTPTEQSVADRFRDVSWVIRVEETDRDGCTHRLITEQSVIRYEYEIHTIENLGVRVQAISQNGHYGCHVYVTAV